MTDREVVGDLERSVEFKAAWDRRHPEPRKNYGVHGVEIVFTMRGPRGELIFPIHTDWQLPKVAEWHATLPVRSGGSYGAQVTFHSPEPYFDGQSGRGEPCEVFGSPDCYSDAGFLLGDEMFKALVEGGEDGLWAELGRLYFESFEPTSSTSLAAEGN